MTMNRARKISLTSLDTPLGQVFVLGGDDGIFRIVIGEGEFERVSSAMGLHGATPSPGTERAAVQLMEFVRGQRDSFDLDIDMSGGTDFQRAVWARLIAIPAGTTSTYAEIARGVGSPRGARAVGGAVGANPLPIVVPCHRVVAAGGLGGYYYGTAMKSRILAIEGVGVEGESPG